MGSRVWRNTAILALAGLWQQVVGMAFQVWLVQHLGATGIGLYSLIGSVNMLCATVAISGIRFTTTRLVSEELGLGHTGGAHAAVWRCLLYALFFGLCAGIGLYELARPLGFLCLRDGRTVQSLQILSLRMPCIALSSVFNGYLIAAGLPGRCACIQIIEQLFTIALVGTLLPTAPAGDLAAGCAAVSQGHVAGDLLSCLLSALVYLQHHASDTRETSSQPMTGRMLRIAVPLALSAYARSGLGTARHLLIPGQLQRYGLGADDALGGYGRITGMALPVIGFPTCLLGALAEVTVPVLTAAQMRQDLAYIRRTVRRLWRGTLLFSLAVTGWIWLCAEPLCAVLYHEADLAPTLRLISLLCPVIYMDIVTDGCLKGLGQMMHSMRYNVAEAILGLVLVYVLLPRYGLHGYLFVLFFCEIFNFALSFQRVYMKFFLQKPLVDSILIRANRCSDTRLH